MRDLEDADRAHSSEPAAVRLDDRATGGRRRIWPAVGLLIVSLAITGCVPADPEYSVAVTNGCDHPIEIVVTGESTLANLETLALYVTTYEAGETLTTATVTGAHTEYVVAGVSRKDPAILQTIEMSPSNPSGAFTVAGDDCVAALP